MKNNILLFCTGLLIAIFIVLFISQQSTIMMLFRDKKTYGIEGMESKEYIKNLKQELSQIEDIVKDTCNNSQYRYKISDVFKIKRISEIVSNMEDTQDNTYKKDLDKIINDDQNEEVDILSNVMKRISIIKSKI